MSHPTAPDPVHTAPASARLTALRTRMAAAACPALFVCVPANLRYLSGYRGEAAQGVITAEQAILITDERFIEQARAECPGWHTLCRDRDHERLGQMLARLLVAHSATPLAWEAHGLTHALAGQIAQDSPALRWQAAPPWIETLRTRKDAQELALLRRAAAIADQALALLLPQIRAGVCERDLAIELEYRMRCLGADGLSFPTLLGFAERSALPHALPGTRRLREGELVLIDFGAEVEGYRSDMTRTYVLGRPDAEQARRFDAVARAQACALEGLAAGENTQAAHARAQHVLATAGLAAYAGKGLGHGIGLHLHEAPFLGALNEGVLETGQVITIEPGVYQPGWGGIRIEDDVLLSEHGYTLLSHAPHTFSLTH